MKKTIIRVAALVVAAVLAVPMIVGCEQSEYGDIPYIDAVTVGAIDIEDEAVALAEAPAAEPKTLKTVASGKKTKKAKKAVIDYSNTADGYVMVKYEEKTSTKLKARVKGPKTTYTYNISSDKWESFPLSEGNGTYTVSVYKNVSGTKYSLLVSEKISVNIKDENSPFLYPNQYVDYSGQTETLKKTDEILKDSKTPLDKVAKVYSYVTSTLTYDKEKAKNVKSGYLPVLDKVLKEKKGICFDYAALMAGMLRYSGVPCKLVVGYAGKSYHAWINVWTEETGWIDGVIFFDGTTWKRMDPTFASSGKKSKSIMNYIGDGKNYEAKYLY